MGKPQLAGIAILAGSIAASHPAAAHSKSFSVTFTDCSEFVGWGPVDLAVAAPLVPKSYTITGASAGNAAIVVRATGCAKAKVGDTPAIPTHLSQIGINLVSPDGTGDINNYTLIYVSDNPYLVAHFKDAGLPAKFDKNLAYEYTPTSDGSGGSLYAAVSPPDLQPYFFYGTETTPPPNSQELFLANWWYGPRDRMKQASTFPNISFGTAAVTLYTSGASHLGMLIGGNADSNFPDLSVRGVYPTAQMTVTVQ